MDRYSARAVGVMIAWLGGSVDIGLGGRLPETGTHNQAIGLVTSLHGTEFDGDGTTDVCVYRPSTGQWFVLPSQSGFTAGLPPVNFGQPGDVPVHGDFDGDGVRDEAVYRPSSGTWFWLKSSTSNTAYDSKGWGVQAEGDTPVPGDYDGDGKTDPTVFRPASGKWIVLKSSTNYTTSFARTWGIAGDVLMQGDYDSDGTTDMAVYRPSSGAWFILPSANGFTTGLPPVKFGDPGDVPLHGDFDGDGKEDLGVYRPSTGTWSWVNSSTKALGSRGWGLQAQGDVPVPGDYDGDRKTDPTVWRPGPGTWFVLKSSTSYTTFASYGWGARDDVPLGGYPTPTPTFVLPGRYRLSFTAATTCSSLPDWARYREYGATIAVAAGQGLTLAVNLDGHTTRFPVSVKEPGPWVQFEFAGDFYYGFRFSDRIDATSLYAVGGRAGGTLNGGTVLGSLAGTIAAVNEDYRKTVRCVSGRHGFSLVRR